MTITAAPTEVAYAGNGVTVAFAIPFPFDTSGDIKVVSTDSDGTPTELSTGFSVTGGGGETGTCTFDTAPAAGVTITILDDPDLTQTADYEANDAFAEDSHEQALDRNVRMIKRMSQRVGRSLRVADGDSSSGDDLLLPIEASRAGKFLAFDAEGQPTALSGTGGADDELREDLAATANGADGAPLVGYRYPTIYGVARSAHAKFRERVSVFDLGVVGDGVTDDTDRMQRATEELDQAELWIPRPARIMLSDSVPRYNQSIIGCAKEYVVFDCGSGNFPAFVNAGHEFITGEIRRVGFIYNSGIKPTNAGTQSNQIAIRMETVNGRSPNYDLYEDIEVRGAWWAFYDDSGSYGSTLRSVFARACKNGFAKENGTTFHFDRCITGGDAGSAGPDTAFFMRNNLAFTFTCCASDRGTPGAGNAVVDFRSMTSFVVNGWDSEGNHIEGSGAALYSFLDSDGVFNAGVEHVAEFEEDASFVARFLVDASAVEIRGHRGAFTGGASATSMSGNGTFYGVLARNGAKVMVSGRWMNPTILSGAPTLRSFHCADSTSDIHSDPIITDMTLGNRARLMVSMTDDHAVTLTGCTTVPGGTLVLSRENSQVNIFLPTIQATSNTTAATLTPALPASYRPARQQRVPIFVTDNTVTAMGVLIIETNGTMTLNATPQTAAFTNSGTKGVAQGRGAYSLD